MVAITVNGEIKTFNRLPKSWSDGNVLHLNLNSESAYELGFRDVVRPEYDSRIEKLGDLHLEGDVYTYDVEDIDFPLTLSKMKEQKVSNLNAITFNRLQKIQWYWDRKERVGTDVPKEIVDEDLEIRADNDRIEAEINALKTKKAVALYELPNFI